MKKMIIIAAIGMTTPFLAQAENAAMATSEARNAPAFEIIDADQDGMITREEASSFSALEIPFDNADTNKDGSLDANELSNSRQAGDSK